MIAIEQINDTEFDWQAWYQDKAQAFTLAAKSWRLIAHTCQLAGDVDGVRMAHGNALQNEAWAKDAEAKAGEYLV